MKINILTQIPNYKQIELTSKILVHGNKKLLSDYPFFTDNKPFPKKIQRMKYDEIIFFFFNKQNFTTIMKSVNVVKKTIKNYDKYRIPNLKNNTRKKKVDTISELSPVQIKFENFIMMLQLLFPTTFPLANNIETSLSNLFMNEIEKIPFEHQINTNANANQINMSTLFSANNTRYIKFLPIKLDQNFSYLNLNQTIYTISHVIWINDVMNHPIYRDVLLKYNIYEQWRLQYAENINQINLDKQSEIVRYIAKLIQRKKLKFEKINRSLDTYSRNYSDFNIFKAKFDDNIQILQNINYNYTTIEQNNTVIEALIAITKLYYTMPEYRNYVSLYSNFNDINKKIRDYEIFKDINDSILYLNFEYLNESEDTKNDYKVNEIRNQINRNFPEFNNFVKIIQSLKYRKIDNPYWKNTVSRIINGESDHNFKELWNEINYCYSISEIVEEDNKNKLKKIEIDEKQKREDELKLRKQKMKKGGKKSNKCKNKNDVLNVGFDIISNENVKKEKSELDTDTVNEEIDTKIKIIEIYLQMDIIEGKVDKQNMNLLDCPYNDLFLGKMYTNLLYDKNEEWNIKKKNIFFRATEILSNNVIVNKNDKNTNLN
jgi:hypothetical protein